jgi:flavin-dependent dehydrogenase
MLDALVVGDGPAGAAFAIAAAAAGMQVGIAGRGRRGSMGEALEPGAQRLLGELGLWESCRETAKELSGVISLWDEPEPIERPAILDVQGPRLGVDRATLDRLLRERARETCAAGLDGALLLLEENGRWSAPVGAPARIEAPLLVIATGRAGCPIGRGERERSDRLVATLSCAPSSTAPPEFCVEAADDGWWYAAPLPGGRSVVGFMTDADLMPRGGLAAVRDAWRAALARTRLAAGFQSPSPTPDLVVRSAGGGIRRELAGDNWVAIGDAAAAYDPICGQGVSIALAKGIAAARLLSAFPSRARALKVYSEAERDAFSDYRRGRSAVYGRVHHRLRDRPFWRRRIAA